jgi:hypothetical protein
MRQNSFINEVCLIVIISGNNKMYKVHVNFGVPLSLDFPFNLSFKKFASSGI